MSLNQSDICTSEDIHNWQRRADKFRYFWQDIKYRLPHDKFAEYSLHKTEPSYSSDIGSLEALFLGEKPSVSICRQYLEESLQEFGYEVSEKFYYDKEEIIKVMKEYRGMYEELDKKSPEDLMDFLSEQAFHDNHIEIGLALGYPLESCEAYSRRNPAVVILNLIQRSRKETAIDFDDMDLKEIIDFFHHHKDDLDLSNDECSALEKCYYSLLRNRPLNTFARVSVYGVSWDEYGVISETSRKVQNRLRAAFELSDILDVFNPLSYNGNGKCVSRYYPTLAF